MIGNSHNRPASLPSGEVHLWFLTDNPPRIGPICADGFTLLSSQEKKRFIDMKNRSMARRFLLGRSMMRQVLARYLVQDPAALAFHNNANGKPVLQGPPAMDISFNLSHSGPVIVLAVTRAPAVGIDLEALDRADAAYRISQRFFSKREIRDLELLGAKAPELALVLWALKESIVKANGDTVWDGLEKISLSIKGRRIDWRSQEKEEPRNWQMAAGIFHDNYVLALAVKSSDDPLVIQTYGLGSGTVEKFEARYR